MRPNSISEEYLPKIVVTDFDQELESNASNKEAEVVKSDADGPKVQKTKDRGEVSNQSQSRRVSSVIQNQHMLCCLVQNSRSYSDPIDIEGRHACGV